MKTRVLRLCNVHAPYLTPSVTFIISAPFPMFTMATPSPMPTTAVTPSEMWDDILKGNVGKDDPLWEEYLGKTDVFDVRMADELNKIVDVFLVYVGYFLVLSRLGCLSSNRA